MRKGWEKPRICIEGFAPNEYIAVCWGVACSTGKANVKERQFYDNPIKRGVTHDVDYCGQTSHQWLIDRDNNNIAESMVEINTNGLGNLQCTIYTDGSYSTERSIGDVKSNSYIYWTTTSGDRTWHHQGWVTDTVPGHPNRS